MISPLKRYRLKSMCTQSDAARAARVSKSTYQSWERGSLSPATEKLEILAKEFRTTVQSLIDSVVPFDMNGLGGLCAERTYFGEVAIHFAGQGAPLLLSITNSAFNHAQKSMQTGCAFLIIPSLDNRTVFIRKDAIADLYFSSEACDDEGVPDVDYEHPVGIFPDIDFWERVGELNNASFNPAHLPKSAQCMSALLQPTLADFEQLIIVGRAEEKDRFRWLAAAKEQSERIFDLANKMTWQMGAVRRKVTLDQESDVLCPLMDLDGADRQEAAKHFISIAIDQQERIIYINPTIVDYISVPTHIYEAQNLQMLDELDV